MNNTFTQELAEIVGLSFGDGSLTLKQGILRFQLRGNITEDRNHYDDYIIPLFNINVSEPIIGKNVKTVESTKSCLSYGFAMHSNYVGQFLNQLGIPIGRKNELPIPEWIKQNKQNAAAFLRGFLDTDGTIYCSRNYSMKKKTKHTQIRLGLTTTSCKLSRDLRELLVYLEIKNDLKIELKKKANRKTAYTIRVSGGVNINKWFSIIGSKNQKHITKYLIWKKFGFCQPYTNLEQRKNILSGNLDPHLLYAGVAERSNALA